MDAMKETGNCPGCKEPYKVGDYEDEIPDFSSGALSLPAPHDDSKGDRRMSMMKRNQNGEFDHNKWLFETQGTYGYGNAYWPPEDSYGDGRDDGNPRGVFDNNADKPWRPLSRALPIPNAIISPYRLVNYFFLFISIVQVVFFFKLLISIVQVVDLCSAICVVIFLDMES